MPDGVPERLPHHQVHLHADVLGDRRPVAGEGEVDVYAVGHGGLRERLERGGQAVLQLPRLQALELGGQRAGLVEGPPRGLPGQLELLLGAGGSPSARAAWSSRAWWATAMEWATRSCSWRLMRSLSAASARAVSSRARRRSRSLSSSRASVTSSVTPTRRSWAEPSPRTKRPRERIQRGEPLGRTTRYSASYPSSSSRARATLRHNSCRSSGWMASRWPSKSSCESGETPWWPLQASSPRSFPVSAINSQPPSPAASAARR